MIENVRQVVENHICTNCGTCVGVCPTGALEMIETPGGEMVPTLDADRCTNCGLCHKVCPQINISAHMKEHLANPYIGPIECAYLGEASDTTIAAESQTGGLTRTLLAFSLESGIADMAVCVMDNPHRPSRPTATLVETPEEALASSRSKYCPIPVNVLIQKILKSDSRIAFVGLGCHLQGLNLAIKNLPKLREKITLKLGLFCDRVLTYAAADYLFRCSRTKPENVAAFDYRHKAWLGWPGDIRVVRRNGEVRNVSRYRRIDSRGLFTPIHCRLCIDKLNALSDIALGDPYGLAKGAQVPTAAIVRTEAGKNLILEAQRAGKINLKPTEAEKIVRHQNITIRMDNCIKFAREMMHRSCELPVFLQTPPLTVKTKGSRPLWVRWAFRSAVFLDTIKGKRVITHTPLWLPILCGGPQRWYRTWRNRLVRLLKRILWIRFKRSVAL